MKKILSLYTVLIVLLGGGYSFAADRSFDDLSYFYGQYQLQIAKSADCPRFLSVISISQNNEIESNFIKIDFLNENKHVYKTIVLAPKSRGTIPLSLVESERTQVGQNILQYARVSIFPVQFDYVFLKKIENILALTEQKKSSLESEIEIQCGFVKIL